MTNLPEWWEWELELSAHLLKRMVDRSFSEVDLRSMIELHTELRKDHVDDRWIITTSHDTRPWEVIIEPDSVDKVLVVITAYPTDLP